MRGKMNLDERKKVSRELFKKAYRAQSKGSIEEAILLYQKSIAAYPTPEAYTFLGWAMSHFGKFEEAIGFCKQAIEIDPQFGNPYNDIGAYLIELGHLDEAIPYLEKATKAPRYESYCYPHYNLGRVWEEKGHLKEAIRSYQKAIEENPEYHVALQAIERLKGSLH